MISYVVLVAQHLLVDSVVQQLEALRAGLEDVLPLQSLQLCFTHKELQVREVEEKGGGS